MTWTQSESRTMMLFSNPANIEINRAKYMEAKNRPCMDCELTWHPAVMTLDHTRRSTKHINYKGERLDPSGMFRVRPDIFERMLALCDAVCMNCHAIREMRRDHTAFLPRWKMFTYKLLRGALMRDGQ